MAHVKDEGDCFSIFSCIFTKLFPCIICVTGTNVAVVQAQECVITVFKQAFLTCRSRECVVEASYQRLCSWDDYVETSHLDFYFVFLFVKNRAIQTCHSFQKSSLSCFSRCQELFRTVAVSAWEWNPVWSLGSVPPLSSGRTPRLSAGFSQLQWLLNTHTGCHFVMSVILMWYEGSAHCRHIWLGWGLSLSEHVAALHHTVCICLFVKAVVWITIRIRLKG